MILDKILFFFSYSIKNYIDFSIVDLHLENILEFVHLHIFECKPKITILENHL